jgi:hypothetical protein
MIDKFSEENLYILIKGSYRTKLLASAEKVQGTKIKFI